MADKPMYEELEQRVKELEKEAVERKHAEEALSESERKYTTLVENSLTGIYIDCGGKIAFANNKFAEIYRYSRDELMGIESWRLVHPEDRALTDEIRIKRLKGEDAPSEYEARGLTKDGKIIWIARRNTRVNYGGKPAILGNIVEVTERKRAEEDLRETVRRIEIAYDQSILYARQLNAEIAERKWAEQALQKAHDELEKRVEERTAELSSTNTLLKNEIGVRKRMEGELQKLNEELKNFVDFVSHELINPITYIQGFSSFLLDSYQGKLGEHGQTCLERIQANSRRMEVLVCDLLTLSSIGKVVPVLSHVPSLEIVKNVIASLEDTLKEKGIELVVADNLPSIHCDRERMFQVFENLFVNAIKFTREAKNPRIEIGHDDTESHHQFYLRDNGIGIDPRYHRKIFEMFQRLNEIKYEEGTGLGLSIVERIVNDHGGRVWVESEKGKGATFYFTLPKAS